LTAEQEEILRQFATLRGEEGPEPAREDHSVFGKIRDAFR